MTLDTLFTIDAQYCIDTNVIVSFMYLSDDEPYRRDVFAEQWDLIQRLISEGMIVSPRRVGVELEKWEKRIPELKKWLVDNRHMFQDPSTDQLSFAKKVVNQYPAYGKNTNAIADLEVITLAAALDLTVITNEKAGLQPSKNRPKIPDVCAANSIVCLSVPGFLKVAQASGALDTKF